jgi:hypothetical protein
MNGWMMIFAFLAMSGAAMTFYTPPATASMSIQIATILFAALLLLCILTRILRRRG